MKEGARKYQKDQNVLEGKKNAENIKGGVMCAIDCHSIYSTLIVKDGWNKMFKCAGGNRK